MTEPASEAPTQAPTEPETEAPAPTQAPAREPDQQPQEQQRFSGKVVLLSMGIALALTMIAALLLVIRKATKKGKYTR